MPQSEEEEEVPETPEDSGPRDNLVTSDSGTGFEFATGIFVSGDPAVRCAVVAVGWVLQWSGPAGPRRYGPCGGGPREPAWARRAREPAEPAEPGTE